MAEVIEKKRLLQHKVVLPVNFNEYNISKDALQLIIPAVMKGPCRFKLPYAAGTNCG